MSPRHASFLASAAIAFAAACHNPTSPTALDPSAGDVALARAPRQQPPNGQRLGTLIDSSGPRTRYKIEYHNGPVMTGTSNIYLIWYGNWQYWDSTAQPIITDLAISLGGSTYFRTTTLYPDGQGTAPSGGLIYGGAVSDLYSGGVVLTRDSVSAIVMRQLDGSGLPVDPRGIYLVLASQDVAVIDTDQRTCAFRQAPLRNGAPIKIVYVGSPARSSVCAAQPIGPNGTLAADAMASLIAAELANTVTDPWLTAWYDRLGYEMADKCAFDYGPTWTAANGAQANVRLGNRDWLLQRLWQPTRKGGLCTVGVS